MRDWRDNAPDYLVLVDEAAGGHVPEWRLRLDGFLRVMVEAMRGEDAGRVRGHRTETAYARIRAAGRDNRPLTRIVGGVMRAGGTQKEGDRPPRAAGPFPHLAATLPFPARKRSRSSR